MGYNHIKAFHQSEERYQGLELNYGGHPEDRKKIFSLCEEAVSDTGLKPLIYENQNESVYIEFHDEYHREGAAFFSIILDALDIHSCETE
ncbi:MAG TPA: hypothetical protein ENK93_01420 [Campylobacteraceae bacterium]|jgi:hypothetical protein|nr:hypothetical protein [Campylobacteraceae bacterium]